MTQSAWELLGVFLITLGILIGLRAAVVDKAESFFVGTFLSTLLVSLGAACFIFKS